MDSPGSQRGRRTNGAAAIVCAWFSFAFLGACGTPTAANNAPLICRDRFSAKCYPCPGALICVDPITCKPIPCTATHPFQDASNGDGSDGKDSSDAGDVAGAPEVGQPDAGCLKGAARCQGNTVQVCQNAAWLDSQACPANQPCQDGACVKCADQCAALGLVECLGGVAALRTCQLNSDKCLAWGVAVACKPGESCAQGLCGGGPLGCSPACGGNQVCSGGTCVDKGCNPACGNGQVCQGGQCVNSGSGSLSCAQVSACSGNCPEGDAACPGECFAQGTSGAQSNFTKYKSCIKATCKSFADQGKINETLFCIFQYCGAEQAACLGSGSGTCSELNDCLGGCSNGATCTSGCNAAASEQAGLDFYGLMTCVDGSCAGLTGDAQAQCAQGSCGSAYTKCFGASTGGSLTSCKQIAECQAGCGGSLACAKNCTAQGTAKAQADVKAFIDCRDQKCGAWCGGGSNPQCSSCITNYCYPQLQACSQ